MKLIRNCKGFLKIYFKGNLEKQNLHTKRYFTTDLNPGEKKVCEKDISEHVILAMKSFSNNKSPGNDGLTKEFYGIFWEVLKQRFMNSLNQAKGS